MLGLNIMIYIFFTTKLLYISDLFLNLNLVKNGSKSAAE